MSVPVLAAIERRVLRRATKVWATSPATREDTAAAARIDADAIGLLPIPVDVDLLRPADDQTWEAALAQPTLVFVGRADDPRKNAPALFDAFARIRAEFPDVQLRLVGRPPLGPLPPGVEATGEVSDIASELQRAALFVLPSRQEGFGIVAAEAMACGLPVVTTPSGGPEDLVRSSGGGVVAAELGAAVISLLRNPEELRRMRRKARDYVAREHAPALFRERLSAALSEVEK
jgi:glycosyltransferase involved in cell wall biosynthesis